MKKYLICFILLFLVIGFSSSHVSAQTYNNFRAPNYVYLEETIHSTRDLTADLKTLLNNFQVFVYVSGCHIDKKALPTFQALTKKYKDAKFLRISQHGSTKKYMLERYASFGAPKMYFFHKGQLLSSMPYYYVYRNRRNKFMGWPASIKRWMRLLHPHIKRLNQYKNIIPVSSYNYRKVMQGKRVVMLRANLVRRDFNSSMNTLYAMAKTFPNTMFTLDTGQIPYDQEYTYKYRKVFRSFSIIHNCDEVIATMRKSYNRNFINHRVISWIKSNLKKKVKYRRKFNRDKKRTGSYLKRVFQQANSYDLATMNVNELKRINSQYRVIASMRIMQTFYAMINAITDSGRNLQTTKVLINELYYKSKGGFKRIVRSRVLRQKVYANVIKRIITYEKNSDIKRRLKALETYYRK